MGAAMELSAMTPVPAILRRIKALLGFARVKPKSLQNSASHYKVGDEVDVFCSNRGHWVRSVKVTAKRADGNIMIETMPGVWFNKEEQDCNLRLPRNSFQHYSVDGYSSQIV